VHCFEILLYSSAKLYIPIDIICAKLKGKVNKGRRESDSVKKRKPPWLLGIFVLVLLTVLVLLQSSNLWKSLTVDSASSVLILYVLSSLNFVAFVIFAFIFGRSLLKLLQERRELQIGSKIKTRLLLYFIGIILLPLIAMPVFSFLFMNRAMDRWFTQPTDDVIRGAGDLQEGAAANQILKFQQTTKMLAKAFDKQTVDNRDFRNVIDTGGLAHIEMISSDSRIIASAEKVLKGTRNLDLKKAVALIHRSKLEEPGFRAGRDYYVALAEMSGGRKLVAIADVSSVEDWSRLVEDSLIRFENQKKLQQSIRLNGILILGLLSFLLIFVASWMARYFAKGLTRPILALAEGADEITRGNLGYQVDVFADDELDVVVKAFNEMSSGLNENAEELAERRKYIETVLQSLSTGVISFDDSYRVTTINDAARQMLRLKDADFTNFELKRMVNDENESALKKMIARAKRVGQATEQTTLVRENPDGNLEKGEDLPVALTATALPNKNGAVLVIEDLSELIAAQRASAWREVARRMAHEIKNPLTPIQLSAERIAKRFSTSNGGDAIAQEKSKESEMPTADLDNKKLKAQRIVKEGTETILREVSSLKSMVNEFSRFAQLPNVELEEGNVNDVIHQATMLYQDRISDEKIELILDENLPKVLIDEEQLKRVFVNLIDNAIEAFDESQEERSILIKTWSDSVRDLVVTELSDNGKGIDPQNFQRLFQPYFSTKGRGTGLGLAIVQRIVSEHDGRIKVVSNTPKGTKFIIELPTNV